MEGHPAGELIDQFASLPILPVKKLAIVVVVHQRGVHVGDGQLRELANNFFRRHAPKIMPDMDPSGLRRSASWRSSEAMCVDVDGEIREWVGQADSKMVEHYRQIGRKDAVRRMEPISFVDLDADEQERSGQDKGVKNQSGEDRIRSAIGRKPLAHAGLQLHLPMQYILPSCHVCSSVIKDSHLLSSVLSHWDKRGPS